MRVGSVSVLAALAVLATAAAPIPFVHHKPPRGGETITYTYSSSPLCPAHCSNYTVTLGPDGQGIVTVNRPKSADRRFQASASQVAAFSASLRPYRANGRVMMDAGGLCRVFITDGDQIEIDWAAADGKLSQLVFNTGCDPDRHRKMRAVLSSAPSLLPIGDLIGPH